MPYPPPPPVVAVVAKENPSAPQVVLKTVRSRHTVGEPVTVAYRLWNADRVPMEPITYCPVGEYDFGAELSVRRADGKPMPAPSSRGSLGYGGRTMREWWTTPPRDKQDTVIVNHGVSLPAPGVYEITLHLRVQRPAGALRNLRSNRVFVRVEDSPAAKAKRKRVIAVAAPLLQNPKTSPEKREKALTAIRYFSEPELLPLLLDFYQAHPHDSGGASSAIALWHDPQAAHRAICRWLEVKARTTDEINVLRLASLLTECDLRTQKAAGKPYSDKAYFAAETRAKATVNRLLLGGSSHLSRGEAGHRRIELLCYENYRTATTDELRPVLAAIPYMTPKQLKGAVWYFAQRRDPPTVGAMRPLRAETQAIAGSDRMPAELRRAMKRYLATTAP